MYKAIFICQVASSFHKLVQLLRMFKNLSYIVTMIEQVCRQLLGYFVFYASFVLMISLMISISDSDLAVKSKQYAGVSSIQKRIIYTIKLTINQFDAGGEGMNNLPQGDLFLSVILRMLTCIFIGVAFTRLIIGEIMTTFKLIHSTIDLSLIHI